MAHCIHFMVAITTSYLHILEDCKAISAAVYWTGLDSGWVIVAVDFDSLRTCVVH